MDRRERGILRRRKSTLYVGFASGGIRSQGQTLHLASTHSFDSFAVGREPVSISVSTCATSHNSRPALLSLITPDFRSPNGSKSRNCILGQSIANKNKPEPSWKSTACASTKAVIDMEGTLQASSSLHSSMLQEVSPLSPSGTVDDRSLRII